MLSYCLTVLAVSGLSSYINIHPFIQITLYALLTYDISSKAHSRSSNSNSLTKNEAMRFPIVASAFLFGAYIFLKFIHVDYTNLLITAYFSLLSLDILYDLFEKNLIKQEQSILKRPLLSFRIPEQPIINYVFEAGVVSFTLSKFISFSISLLLVYQYTTTKHYILNNLIAFVICVKSFEEIHLDSFSNSFILLVGLFLYDIFWVYGTDVMLTVAKKIDAPIKFLIPKLNEGKVQMGLLGLGDIVVPGLHIILMKRFDEFVGNENNVYYKTSLVGYLLGMLVCSFVLYYFKAGQPALFYLVPGLLIASFMTALYRKEVGKLIWYEEKKEEKEKND
eukprot:GAHX01002296.1.p1 GENE.GAHX01002296.1~~GAHX01002296.1.p1  ORF type:complete len:335 (-),score=46.06 GAHX01002296.1:31-1035(-)